MSPCRFILNVFRLLKLYQNIDLFSVSYRIVLSLYHTFCPLFCQFILCESSEWAKSKKKTIYVNIYYVSQRLIFCLLAFRSYFFRFFFARLNHNRDKHLWWTNFNLTLSIFYWFLFYFIFVDRHRFVFPALLLFLGQCFTLFYCKIPHFITSHSIFM